MTTQYESKRYHAGLLDQQVEILRDTPTPDGRGGYTEAQAVYDTLFAHIRSLSGKESVDAERLESKASVVVVIRTRTDLTTKDHIRWSSHVMQIRGGLPANPRSKWLELQCELGAAV